MGNWKQRYGHRSGAAIPRSATTAISGDGLGEFGDGNVIDHFSFSLSDGWIDCSRSNTQLKHYMNKHPTIMHLYWLIV